MKALSTRQTSLYLQNTRNGNARASTISATLNIGIILLLTASMRYSTASRDNGVSSKYLGDSSERRANRHSAPTLKHRRRMRRVIICRADIKARLRRCSRLIVSRHIGGIKISRWLWLAALAHAARGHMTIDEMLQIARCHRARLRHCLRERYFAQRSIIRPSNKYTWLIRKIFL